MHRLRARLLGGGDDPLDHEIRLGRRGRSDRDRLVGHFDVKRARRLEQTATVAIPSGARSSDPASRSSRRD